jgi:hypothetical protein
MQLTRYPSREILEEGKMGQDRDRVSSTPFMAGFLCGQRLKKMLTRRGKREKEAP